MKDIDLGALFCEVLGGLVAGLVGWAIWDWLNPGAWASMTEWLATHYTLSVLTTSLLVAYFLGLIVDAFGLWFDRVVIDNVRWFPNMGANPPNAFRAKVSAHLFAYWKEQWTYYSCYRNLLMLVLVGFVPGARAAGRYGGTCALFVALGAAIAICFALAYSMRALLVIYYGIPQAFDES